MNERRAAASTPPSATAAQIVVHRASDVSCLHSAVPPFLVRLQPATRASGSAGWRLALAAAFLIGCTSRAPAPPSPVVRGPAATAVATQATPAIPPSPTAQEKREEARVLSVIDGDTIEIDRAGTSERVRYIGIDAPELYGQGAPQPFAEEARRENERLVGGRVARLERDVSDRDSYGRLLRYVYVDGVFVNERLVEQGLARARRYPPDTALQSRLQAAEQRAQQAGLGIWSIAPGPMPTPTAIQAPTATAPPASSSPSPIPVGVGAPTPAGTGPPSETPTAAPRRPTPQTPSSPPPGCQIKGNISSSGERIYHVPGGRFYDSTIIDLGRGERWFCSEEEARAAGWRRSRQ